MAQAEETREHDDAEVPPVVEDGTLPASDCKPCDQPESLTIADAQRVDQNGSTEVTTGAPLATGQDDITNVVDIGGTSGSNDIDYLDEIDIGEPLGKELYYIQPVSDPMPPESSQVQVKNLIDGKTYFKVYHL